VTKILPPKSFYKEMYKDYLHAAKSGDVDAMISISHLGEGLFFRNPLSPTKKEKAKALKFEVEWLTKAATLGSEKAKELLCEILSKE